MITLASQLEAARSQMAFTLGFHIILASLGVAFPAMMLIANYRGLKRDDADALLLARRWSKVVAVTFAVGAVTGTVLSFEFGLLWPAFTGRFGKVFGVLFACEGIFFFLETIFIAVYIFGWKRLAPWRPARPVTTKRSRETLPFTGSENRNQAGLTGQRPPRPPLLEARTVRAQMG